MGGMKVPDIVCPRCRETVFDEVACGDASSGSDVVYTSLRCTRCALWWDSWRGRWLIDVDYWREAEDAMPYYDSIQIGIPG